MAEKKSSAEDVAVTQETAATTDDVIAYIGMSDWRSITESDWLGVKVKGKDRMWSSENNHEIALSEFSDGEVAWLKADADDFVIRKATPVAPIPVSETPDPAQHYGQ